MTVNPHSKYDSFLLSLIWRRLTKGIYGFKFDKLIVNQEVPKTLLAEGFIEYDCPNKTSLNLSYKGAEYLYEHYKSYIDESLVY